MSFDSVVANPGRLQILTALAVEERQEFVQLRRTTRLTDGNLAAHARRLHTAGFVDIDKQFRGGKPVTSFVLTTAGRTALEAHARRLLAAISHRRISRPIEVAAASSTAVTPQVTKTIAPEPQRAEVAEQEPVEDWVD